MSRLPTSWSPVKFADLFDRFFPDLGAQTRDLPLLFGASSDVGGRLESVSVPVSLYCSAGRVRSCRGACV